MIHNLRPALSHWIKGWLAGLCVFVLVVVMLLGSAPQAVAATEGSLSETMDLKINQAAQKFVTSVLEDYEDALKDSFSATLKPLKSVAKDLTKQLSKLAETPTPDITTLAPKLAASQAALETAEMALGGLVEEAAAFKATLASSPDLIKDTIEAQIGSQFEDLQGAFDGIAQALSALSQDTATLDESDIAAALGQITEDSAALTQTLELAKAAIGAFEK